MSLRHFLALSYVADPGGISQQQLSEILCIDANNTVLLLNEMEGQGLIRRVRDPTDRRRHLVEVTEHGQELFAARPAAAARRSRTRSWAPSPPRSGPRCTGCWPRRWGTEGRARLRGRRRLHRRAPAGQPGGGVHRTPTGLSAELMQRAARELNLSETVFVLGSRRASATPTSGSSPRRSSCPSPAIPCWAPRSCSASASGSTPSACGPPTGRRRRARAPRRRGRVRRDGAAPSRPGRPFDRADELLAALGVQRSELPVEVYDNGPRHT